MLKDLTKSDWLSWLNIPEERIPRILVLRGTRTLKTNYAKQRHPITLDVCPTSNCKLGLVSSLADHPIRRLFDLGIRVTVSSDDPLFFETTISEEYRRLRGHLQFSYEELKQITLYAVEGAFLSEAERATLRQEIEQDFVAE